MKLAFSSNAYLRYSFAEAARRVAVAHSPDETETSVRRAHKIDSLLRGNWVVEIEALSRSTGLPVLHVAGSPAIGRTCVKGVVRADGDVVADLSNHPLYGARLSRMTDLVAWSRDGNNFFGRRDSCARGVRHFRLALGDG